MTSVLDSCSQQKQANNRATKRPLSVLREITENSRRPSMDREDDFPVFLPSPSKRRKTDSTLTATFDNLVPLRPLSLAHPYPVPSTSPAIQPLQEQNTTQSRDTDASTTILPRENVEGDEITHESNHALTLPTRDNDTQYPDAADHPPHTIAPITITHAPPTAFDASPHSPSSPCSPPFWDIQSPIPETESSPPRSSSVETSSAAPAPVIIASNDLLSSVRPRRTTSASTNSLSVTRRSKQNMQPRWQTQSYMVFLALRQHPARCLPRTELIKAALEMDKKISEERGLPRVFRGKTPMNSCSAVLTNNGDHYFIPFKPPGSRSTHFKLAYEPGSFESAVVNYNSWMKTLIEKDWPVCFGVLKAESVGGATEAGDEHWEGQGENDNKKEDEKVESLDESVVVETKDNGEVAGAQEEVKVVETGPASPTSMLEKIAASKVKEELGIPSQIGEDDMTATLEEVMKTVTEQTIMKEEKVKPLVEPEKEETREGDLVQNSEELTDSDNKPAKVETPIPTKKSVKLKLTHNHETLVTISIEVFVRPTRTSCASAVAQQPADPTYIDPSTLDLSNVPHSLSDILEVRPSTIPGAGNGLFAVRDLPFNTPLGFYFGVPMTEDEFDSLKDGVGLASHYSIMYRKTVLDATDERGMPYSEPGGKLYCPFHFLNEHTDKTRVNVNFVDGFMVNQVICFTRRRIEAGEELFVDYGKEVDRTHYVKVEEVEGADGAERAGSEEMVSSASGGEGEKSKMEKKAKRRR